MKRQLRLWATAGCLTAIAMLLIVIGGLQHKSWLEYTPGQINRLAIAVEAFRQERGVYPDNLAELQRVRDLYDRELLTQVLSGESGTVYSYRVVSNGFVIVATKSARLFSQRESMERSFETGQTFGVRTKVTTSVESVTSSPTLNNGKGLSPTD